MIFPNSTLKGMKELLAAHGIEVKGRTNFSCVHFSTFLRWNYDGKRHSAYFTTSCGQPYLSVDGKPIELTLSEVKEFGLLDEK